MKYAPIKNFINGQFAFFAVFHSGEAGSRKKKPGWGSSLASVNGTRGGY